MRLIKYLSWLMSTTDTPAQKVANWETRYKKKKEDWISGQIQLFAEGNPALHHAAVLTNDDSKRNRSETNAIVDQMLEAN